MLMGGVFDMQITYRHYTGLMLRIVNVIRIKESRYLP